MYDGIPAMLWNPTIQTSASDFEMRTSHFGFTITGTSGLKVVVGAASSLQNADWSPVSTNVLIGGTANFTDPESGGYRSRFYRIQMPQHA